MKSRDMQIAEAVAKATWGMSGEGWNAEYGCYNYPDNLDIPAIIASIPAPEPVAWKYSKRYGSGLSFQKPEPPTEPSDMDDDWYCIPLYAEPPAAEINRQLLDALKMLSHKYVCLLEGGRDRIIQLGGDCDPVDVMERDDPYLKQCREAIAAAEKELK